MSALKRKSKDEVNVTASNKSGEILLSKGVPLDPMSKHLTPLNSIGVSIGVTKNMGDYESLRVDVWCNDLVHEDETKQEAFSRLTDLLSETLSETVSSLIGED